MNDVARIAFVTRRFNELKGLSMATTGGILLAGSLILRFLFASTTYAIEPVYFVNAALCSMSFSWTLFEPRYRATFGRTESSLGEAFLVVTNLLLMVGLLIDLVAKRFVQWPSAAAIALGLSSLVIVIRDWRWRLHHLVPLVAAVLAAAMTASIPAGAPAFSWEGDSLRGSVFLMAYALMGAGMIAAGLLDHALLVETLRPGSAADGGVVPSARFRAARSESRMAAVVGGCALLTLFFPPVEMVIALPFSLSMVLIGAQILSTVRRTRQQKASPLAVPAQPLDGARDLVVPLIVFAVAATIDVALSSSGPVVCTAAFGAWSLRIAIRSWSSHRHYLIGAITAAGLLVVMPHLVPARALTVCVLAIAAALAVERYADSEIENTHADAI